MGGPVPKQFRLLGGVPLLLHSVRTFSAHPQIGAVVLVTDVAQAAALSLPAGVRLVPGGATRQASVRAGLAALAETAPEYVFIHDAARPFVTAAQISAVAAALTPDSGALLAVPVADTLKQAAPALPPVYCHPGESRDLWQEKSLLRHEIPAFAGMTEPFDSEKNKLMGGKQAAPDTAPLPRIGTTLPRDGLWAAQTPQAFPYALIEDAHRELADRDLTDDAALFEALGRPVRLVPGDRRNFKLTTPEDFIMAEALLAAALPAPLTEIRTGMGFDVHGFTDGDAVILGGVRVPHTHRLAGHSDADVALHALTDALLGAIGAGDIGQHFPPSDPQWRGRDSRHFLRHAVSLLAARGGSVVNADLTIICETPKIGPHRDAMRGVIAADLGVTPDRVNVKGTTTERLGFTGRGEGIAAQAVISVRLPV